MIEFKILSTVDKTQIGNYQHTGSELSIGQTEGDMLVDDPQLSPLQLKISFPDGQVAQLENLGSSVEVRVNGKAIGESAPLKEKDTVVVGRTTIQFSQLNTRPATIPPTFEHPQATNRFTPGSKEQAVLDSLSTLEKMAGGGSAPSAMPSPPRPPGMPAPAGASKMPPPLPKPGKPPLPNA